ncbi:MAG TPA: integrase repeat-containing protein [Candidatus Andersenbacteria bacterium]|nr:integrase repeat-containing protein [Candidatus Andersenbacteria bacterium]
MPNNHLALYAERLAQRYLAEAIDLPFDEYVRNVSFLCPNGRHLVAFLNSEATLEQLMQLKPAGEFYRTWQEASEVVQQARIGSSLEYQNFYKEIDPRLPSTPNGFYDNFPCWDIFLGRFAKYQSWQEASVAAISAGISSRREYCARYKEIDSQLPRKPDAYPGFPGWKAFLGTAWYSTWQEASVVAKVAAIATSSEYFSRCKKVDLRLPYSPGTYYPDFPGWYVFLGNDKPVEHFATWQEASAVVVAAGVTGAKEYYERHQEIDARLPSNPDRSYGDFPGWYTFLAKQQKYSTWQEASLVAIAAGVSGMRDYYDRCHAIDPRLPFAPYQKYPDFPGWYIFLGKDKPTLSRKRYATWQEASAVAVASGVSTRKEYVKRYRDIDLQLPGSPDSYYPDFPGWRIFLGKKAP